MVAPGQVWTTRPRESPDRSQLSMPTEGDGQGDARAATLAFPDDRLAAGVTACRPYVAAYSESERKAGLADD